MGYLVQSRNHQLISGKMNKNQREICYVVYCPIHDHTMETSYFNYKRSRTGCLLCGRDIVSSKLTGRKFDEESIQKMSISAKSRPDRGGKPRRWRETHSYRVWNVLVRNEWNNECAITGIRNVIPGKNVLVVHHLVSASECENLVLTVENGILIHKNIHQIFHSIYGYRKNNVAQFLDFILKLTKNEIVESISSQGELEGSQGSETRVYDSERIMKLHERLSEIALILETILLN